MKSFCNVFVFTALSANLLLAPLAMAQQTDAQSQGANNSTPSDSDLKNSKDRGLMFTPVTPLPRSVTAATQASLKPATKAQPAAHKTAAQKPKKPPVETAISKPASHPETQTANLNKPHSTMSTDQSAIFKPNTDAGTLQTVSHSDSLAVKGWLNKPGNSPSYKVGEKMQVNVTANQDCNVMVFDFDGKNTLTQIFPNKYQDNGSLKAGQTIAIGGPDSPFDYQIEGKGGAERIFVYAYPIATSSPMTIAFAPPTTSPFRSANMTSQQYLDLVNKSKVFFAREIKVVPKNGVKPVSYNSGSAPNKIELPFVVK